MHNFLVIGLAISSGLVTRRVFDLPANFALSLNRFVIFIALPAVVLQQIPAMDMNLTLWFPVLGCWLAIAVSAAIILFMSKRLNWSAQVTGALLLVTPLGNTSYLGFPLVSLLLGEEAMPYAILYDQLGTFAALAIYGTVIANIYGSGEKKLSVRGVALQILKFPPFIALLIALYIPPAGPELSKVLSLLASTLVPATMFIIGLQFRLNVDAGLHRALLIGLATKMLLAPLILLTLGLLTGQPHLLLAATVLEAAMPPMVTASVIGIAAGLHPRLCVSMVGVGILVSMVSIPLWHLLLQALR